MQFEFLPRYDLESLTFLIGTFKVLKNIFFHRAKKSLLNLLTIKSNFLLTKGSIERRTMIFAEFRRM